MLEVLSKGILKMIGWKTKLTVDLPPKYVLVGAPHTSNWDFPLTLLALPCMGIRFNWVAKHTLFRWPFGGLFRAIGGIPVDRSTGTSFLISTIELFEKRSQIALAIAPEGTRSKTAYWKTGFYTIARKAGAPVVLGYIDYAKKCIGIGEVFSPTGDIDADFEIIRRFYRDKVGKIAENQGEIRLKKRKWKD